MIEGTIFTQPPNEKRYTALFIGGSDMVAGQELFEAVQQNFFANFRVSTMLDSNGINTTAATSIVKLLSSSKINGKKMPLY